MRQRVSIIIVTYRRPASVRECLVRLQAQTDPPDQIIVVDGSEDRSTAAIVSEFPRAIYLHNPSGAGNMTSSRNVALRFATGDIFAFLDDDAYAEPKYVQNLRRAYADSSVALACSRTLNGLPDESSHAGEGVGKLLADGRLAGNFAFDPGPRGVLDIEHGIGATMSFRRSTLQVMGGFREDYQGFSGVREDTDAFLRARRLGLRAVFIGDAIAHHIAAPQAKGRRFDLRYEYWAGRNHALLLVNNFGVASHFLRRSIAAHLAATLADRKRTTWRRSVRAAVALAGFLSGIGLSLWRHGGRPLSPSLENRTAEDLRARLALDSARQRFHTGS